MAFGTKNGYILTYDFSDYLESHLNVQPVSDRRDYPEANPLRNDNIDGSKYFPLGLSNILESDVFKDIDPQKRI